MKKASALMFVLSLTVLVAHGCTKKEATVTGSEAPAAQPPAAPAAPAVAADSVGVPECDNYITKYQSCLKGKVPEAAQAAMQAAFDATIVEWKKVAATPEGKSSLATACTSALDASKQAMGAYGCEW